MAVPRRTRISTRATTLATQKPSGITKKLAAQKQQRQGVIQRFGRISKLATSTAEKTCIGKAIEEDLISVAAESLASRGVRDAEQGLVGRRRKRKYIDDGDLDGGNDGDDEEAGMVESTAALMIRASSEKMSPLRTRYGEESVGVVGKEQTQQLRGVLVTERRKAELLVRSQLSGDGQEARKRKRVTFDDDDDVDHQNNETIGNRSDAISTSQFTSDTSIKSSTLSSSSLTRTSMKTSEAIYRAGISESIHSSQSPSKRPRNALLSSTRLLAGQRRLDDIKTDAANAREKASKPDRTLPKVFAIYEGRQKLEEKENDDENKNNNKPSPPAAKNNDVSARNQSLLDRILAKQQWLAALPQAPSKAERERRAALQRVEEVVAVLTLLAGRGRASGLGGLEGGGELEAAGNGGSGGAATTTRVSFPLQVLVKNVQGSVRSPMASEEVLKCLEVLEAEVGPAGFVKVVRTGGVCAVVVCPRLRPAVADLRKRVEEALAIGERQS